MNIIEETTTPDGVRVRLLDRDIAAFAIIFEDGNLAGIGHLTTDFGDALLMYRRAVMLAEKGRLVHPAWRKTKTTRIPINTLNGDVS